MTFVADASFVAAWIFEDEATPQTWRYLDIATEDGFYVPALWKFEIANLLRMAERRERLSSETVDLRLKMLNTLVIEEDDLSISEIWRKVLPFARKHDLTVYDAAYVEIAKRLELPLASCDKAMIEAARQEMIDVITA